jgi:hypothetical protein
MAIDNADFKHFHCHAQDTQMKFIFVLPGRTMPRACTFQESEHQVGIGEQRDCCQVYHLKRLVITALNVSPALYGSRK